MAVDIVVPKGNEEEFLKMAEKLGYSSLIFLSDKPKQGKTAFLAKNSKEISRNVKKFDYMVADKPWAFNDKRVDIIYNLEGSKRDDFMHHRASGLNQVLCRQARDNNTAIAFNIGLLRGERKHIVLGRMMQNVRLCRKYKVKMVIATFAGNPYGMRGAKDLVSLGVTMGMHPKEAKEALDY